MKSKHCFRCLLMILGVLLGGCQTFVIDKHLIGDYYLIAVDTDDDLTVCYSKGNGLYDRLMPETVFAVAVDKNYILALQHPKNGLSYTNHYIIPVKNQKTKRPMEGIVGPLTLDQFRSKCRQLGLSKDLHFLCEDEL